MDQAILRRPPSASATPFADNWASLTALATVTVDDAVQIASEDDEGAALHTALTAVEEAAVEFDEDADADDGEEEFDDGEEADDELERLCEAAQLLGTMQADAGKKLVAQIYAGSQKECVIAYKNALMKKVYVHESMKKFIDRVQKDGQVEMHVIRGDVADSEFGKFGSLLGLLFFFDMIGVLP